MSYVPSGAHERSLIFSWSNWVGVIRREPESIEHEPAVIVDLAKNGGFFNENGYFSATYAANSAPGNIVARVTMAARQA